MSKYQQCEAREQRRIAQEKERIELENAKKAAVQNLKLILIRDAVYVKLKLFNDSNWDVYFILDCHISYSPFHIRKTVAIAHQEEKRFEMDFIKGDICEAIYEGQLLWFKKFPSVDEVAW